MTETDFETALAARIDSMNDACTRCGKCVEVCPVTGPAGVGATPPAEVMGGVFERFPKLAFGVIECGASWVGPMCERMDAHADLMAKVGFTYSMKPSEFVRRNVRTAPFFHEDFAATAEQYGLHEIFCVMTDYPHLEGGRHPFGSYMKTASKLGPKFARDFFQENGKWLFPDLAAA